MSVWASIFPIPQYSCTTDKQRNMSTLLCRRDLGSLLIMKNKTIKKKREKKDKLSKTDDSLYLCGRKYKRKKLTLKTTFSAQTRSCSFARDLFASHSMIESVWHWFSLLSSSRHASSCPENSPIVVAVWNGSSVNNNITE